MKQITDVLAVRASLATDLYRLVFEYTETFEENKIGSDLAYLLGAILTNGFVEWSASPERALVKLLQDCLPADHLIWNFIHITKD